MITQEQREFIKKYLRRGGITTVATLFGVSQVYVSQVLRGERKNEKMLEVLISMAQEGKVKFDKIAEFVKTI